MKIAEEIAGVLAKMVVGELYPLTLAPEIKSKQVRKEELEKWTELFRSTIAAKLEPVKNAFASLLEEYIELISSGDCGYCDVENDEEIASLRGTLAMLEGEE